MHFSTILDFEHDVFAVLSRSGYISYITQPPAGHSDVRKPEQLIGHHISEFVHPDDVHNFDRWLEPEFELHHPGTTSGHIMFRVRRLDGSWRWLEATMPYLEGHHVPDCIFIFLRDIAAHRLVEGQYRLSEEMAGYGIWNIEQGSPHAQMSAGTLRLFGFELGDPETKKKFWPLSRLERQDARKVLRTLRQALEKPQKFSFLCTVRAKDGSRRVLKTRGFVVPNHAGTDQIFGISHDITALHLAEQRLRASEEQYRLLTQRASDIICQLTLSGTIEFISPSVLRLTGRRPSRLKGLNFTSLLPEQEHEKFQRFLAQLRNGEEKALCTVRFKGLGEGDSWLEISGQTLKDTSGGVYGLVCAARDISERKKFELDLQAARERAEQLSASKSKFLGHISHELRTPLNAILGFSEMIRDHASGARGDARYAEYGALIHESGSILSSLINDLLDLSKIEAGKYRLHAEPVNFGEVTRVCLQQVRPQAVKKKIAIDDQISTMNLRVQADKRALTQILMNLLSNAVKFTPEGGHIELFARADGNRTRISVRDSGIGIRKADIERITEPFEQVTEEPALSRKGTGLGLALVKSLVELHHGELLIDSEPGKGTTVSVVLPAVETARRAVA